MSVTFDDGDNPLTTFSHLYLRHSLPQFTTTYGHDDTVMTLFPLCRGLQDQFFHYIQTPANYVLNGTVSGETRSVLETNTQLTWVVLG
jgi:hypothetical protein